MSRMPALCRPLAFQMASLFGPEGQLVIFAWWSTHSSLVAMFAVLCLSVGLYFTGRRVDGPNTAVWLPCWLSWGDILRADMCIRHPEKPMLAVNPSASSQLLLRTGEST